MPSDWKNLKHEQNHKTKAKKMTNFRGFPEKFRKPIFKL